jgi:uncharacterized integral membrane protein
MKYLIITIVVLVLVFVFQNMQVVDIRFLFWKVSILFFAVAFGFICGLLFRLSLRSRKGL